MRIADIVTATGGFLAGVSIILGITGYVELGVRVLIIAYIADVLDGWVARRLGEQSREGLMLDRAYDRISQVVAPLVLYASWITYSQEPSRLYIIVLAVYAGGLVTIAVWRLVRRIVATLDYFAGLPFFVHALLMILSIIASTPIHPLVLLGALIASTIPIPYTRKLGYKATPSPGFIPRLIILVVVAIIPYSLEIVAVIAKLIIYALIIYLVLGPLPPLLGITPKPRKG